MPNYNHSLKTKTSSLLFAFTVLLLSITGCGSKKSSVEQTKKNLESSISAVSLSDNISDLIYGDSIILEVRSTQDSITIDKISFFVNQKEVQSTRELRSTLNSVDLGIGKIMLQVNVHLSTGKTETHGQSLFIKSDIIPETLTYKRIKKFPHDPDAYTQGLIFDHGRLLESTGQYGESSLRLVDLESGSILKKISIDKGLFGEGITILGNKLFHLTWKSKKGFVYDKNTFEQIGSFTYPNEGWGITTIDSSLVMSDGTNLLYFLDPKTFVRQKTIQVYDQDKAVLMLNELEFFNGKIYANVYQTEQIVAIDPATGRVLERINLQGIFNRGNYGRRIDVLNGIAYNDLSGKIYVTGKYWPRLFEVEFVQIPSS